MTLVQIREIRPRAKDRGGYTSMNGPAFVATIHHLGFAQNSFADFIGMREETVSRWAQGHRRVPRVVLRLLSAMMSLEADAS